METWAVKLLLATLLYDTSTHTRDLDERGGIAFRVVYEGFQSNSSFRTRISRKCSVIFHNIFISFPFVPVDLLARKQC
jgi:hypothetical protein